MHLEPTSYVEAVVQQNPDIKAKLDNLCRDLAMCSIYKDQSGIMQVVRKGLEKATVEHNQLGYKNSFARLFLILQRSIPPKHID
jgi:hypothetical protein